MKVTKERDMTVYNLDQNKLQKLVYPGVMEVSDQTDEVASIVRDKNAPENLKFWANLILSAAQDITAKQQYMMASSQSEGGFFVTTHPDDVAFFECSFKHGSEGANYLSKSDENFKEFERLRKKEGLDKAMEFARKVSRENFGFRCRPIYNGEIGPNNWLYGHLYRGGACQQLYDRKEQKVVSATEREDYPVHRYWCGIPQSDVDDYLHAWQSALKSLQEYDDIIRYNWADLKALPISETFKMREALLEQFEKAETEQKQEALMKFIEYLATKGKIESAEEFRKLFVKRYGHMPF